MKDEEYILITGGPEVPDTLERALGAALPVRLCPGPEGTCCPAVHEERCTLRAGAKATVVYLAGEHQFFSPGRWACVTADASPVIVVLEGSSQPPRGGDGFAIVGGAAGPIGVLEALTALFDNPDQAPKSSGRVGESDSRNRGYSL